MRENGPSLRLADAYNETFPSWLWNQIVTERPALAGMLDAQVLVALGQFMERPDLASGPRTVADVFQRIINASTLECYNLDTLLFDLQAGNLRYFGDGEPVRRLMSELLGDEWVSSDPRRQRLVETLIAYPQGCPINILQARFGSHTDLDEARRDLFGPLLVELSNGLALEGLQRVKRKRTHWEALVERSFETLPAIDVLEEYSPELVRRVVLPVLFPPGEPTAPQWNYGSTTEAEALSGWTVLRGSFNPAFPNRTVGIFVGTDQPQLWPTDFDVAIAFQCCPDDEPSAELLCDDSKAQIVFRMPVRKRLTDNVPVELARYKKYVNPDDLRPVVLLTALQELSAFLHDDELCDDDESRRQRENAAAFYRGAIDYLLHELLHSTVNLQPDRSVRSRGRDLLSALFFVACKSRFSAYITLCGTPTWQDLLARYGRALADPQLSYNQRIGNECIRGEKSEISSRLFGISSTAQFDSFCRTLAPFLAAAGTAAQFELTLTRHPAETRLMEYIRKFGTHGISPEASVELLRHDGYTALEATAILSLLEARQEVMPDEHGIYIGISNAESLQAILIAEVSAMQKELYAIDPHSEPIQFDALSSVADLKELIQRLRDEKERKISAFSAEVSDCDDRMLTIIGSTRAWAIPDVPPGTDFHFHLTGAVKLLSEAQERILHDSRAIRDRVTAMGAPEHVGDTAWASGWASQRDSLLTDIRKVTDRQRELSGRLFAIQNWCDVLPQVNSLKGICQRIESTDPHPAGLINAVISAWRERLATEHWAPILDFGAFSADVSKIQERCQGLLFSQMQAYLSQRTDLLRRYPSLLSNSDMPDDEKLADVNLISELPVFDEMFSDMYSWALESFEAALLVVADQCASGGIWKHPTDPRKSWKRHKEEADQSLLASRSNPSIAAVQCAGDLIQAAVEGSGTAASAVAAHRLTGEYNDPLRLPDFGEIERLFKLGYLKVSIDLRVRRPAS